YDVVDDAMVDFEMLFSDESGELVCNEVKVVLSGLGEDAIRTFVEFENVVKGENSRRALSDLDKNVDVLSASIDDAKQAKV
ncbi:exocyst complex component EXO70B1-like protein, partial [Tanacetum coccineum]